MPAALPLVAVRPVASQVATERSFRIQLLTPAIEYPPQWSQ